MAFSSEPSISSRGSDVEQEACGSAEGSEGWPFWVEDGPDDGGYAWIVGMAS